jgi:bifunctional UDP-N-acetylglucosamine pyrophosphorylase/glucosamine-1-phosphate N-acetyltransferase
MKSDLPKVLHTVGDPARPMVCAVIDACREAGCGRIVLVVGYKQELVRAAIDSDPALRGAGIEFAVQAEQHGTGHAVRCAEPLFEREKHAAGHATFVLAGDGPLIRAETLRAILRRHRDTGAAATLATSVIDDPAGYGRIVRDPMFPPGRGRFVAIVEERNCTPEQRAIREVNPSYYCFQTGALFEALARVERNPASGEYYVTDVPGVLLREGRRVEVIDAVPPEDVLSINTPQQLAEVDRIYRARRAARAAAPAGTPPVAAATAAGASSTEPPGRRSAAREAPERRP